MNYIIQIAKQITMSNNKIVSILFKIKNKNISINKNYNFYFQMIKLLKFKNKYFAYIIKSNLITIQIKNILIKLYIISKIFKIKYFCDYNKKNNLTYFKNHHFVIILIDKLDLKTLKIDKKTILLNNITIYKKNNQQN